MDEKKQQNFRNVAAALMLVLLVLIIVVVMNNLSMGAEAPLFALLMWLVGSAMTFCWVKATEETEEWPWFRWASQMLLPAVFGIAVYFLIR